MRGSPLSSATAAERLRWRQGDDAIATVGNVSRSQDGEDVYAFLHFFYGNRGGSFLEMGALDGLLYSNTYAFDQVLGWKGVLIEASPASFERLQVNRPEQTTLHAAICGEERVVHYLEHPSACCRGIAEFMTSRFRARWYPTLTSDGGWHFAPSASGGGEGAPDRLPPGGANSSTANASLPASRSRVDATYDTPIRPVKCVPLGTILDDAKTHFDFFSLDVEGGEFAVLSAINFSQFSFNIICIEADGTDHAKEDRIVRLLRSKGYRYHSHVMRNDWFIREGFRPSRSPHLQLFS